MYKNSNKTKKVTSAAELQVKGEYFCFAGKILLQKLPI